MIEKGKSGEKKLRDSYHLSILGVFVSIGRTPDVIPHLTGCHCKNYTLSQRGGEEMLVLLYFAHTVKFIDSA